MRLRDWRIGVAIVTGAVAGGTLLYLLAVALVNVLLP